MEIQLRTIRALQSGILQTLFSTHAPDHCREQLGPPPNPWLHAIVDLMVTILLSLVELVVQLDLFRVGDSMSGIQDGFLLYGENKEYWTIGGNLYGSLGAFLAHGSLVISSDSPEGKNMNSVGEETVNNWTVSQFIRQKRMGSSDKAGVGWSDRE